MFSPAEIGNIAAHRTKRAGFNPMNLLRGMIGRKPPTGALSSALPTARPTLGSSLPIARPAVPPQSPSGLLQWRPDRVPVATPLGTPTARPAQLPVAQPVAPQPNMTTLYRGLQQPFRGLPPSTIQAEPRLERAAEQYLNRHGTVGLSQQPFYEQLSRLRRPQYFANSPDVAQRFGPYTYRLDVPKQVAASTPRLHNTGGQVATTYDATTLQGLLNRPDVSMRRLYQAQPLQAPVAQPVPFTPTSGGSGLSRYLPPAIGAGGIGAGGAAYALSR